MSLGVLDDTTEDAGQLMAAEQRTARITLIGIASLASCTSLHVHHRVADKPTHGNVSATPFSVSPSSIHFMDAEPHGETSRTRTGDAVRHLHGRDGAVTGWG